MNKNNTSSNLIYYIGFTIATIIIVLALFYEQNFMKSPSSRPSLNYYVAKVNSKIQDDNYRNARLELENSVFQSVSNIILNNPKITYSEALDKILPMSKIIASPQNGILVVIQNDGDIAAQDIQIDINLQVPIEKYKIFSMGTASVLSEDKSKGILKISLDKIKSADEATIAVLLSNKYDVFLTALRTESLQPTIIPTDPNTNPMRNIEIMAQQTKLATYDQTSTRNLLKFIEVYDIDKIQPIVSVYSKQAESYLYEVQRNKIKEQDLFIQTFGK